MWPVNAFDCASMRVHGARPEDQRPMPKPVSLARAVRQSVLAARSALEC